MAVFELVIALLLVGAGLSAVARRAKAPYPALLALAGAALALLPRRAERHARSRARPHPPGGARPAGRGLRFLAPRSQANWRAVTGLALAAVGLTVAAVAVVARWLVPEIPWAAAIALGAIVAPPDAAAATAVLKQLRPPHRILVILQGESLFNDASALLIYRVAVTATMTGAVIGWSALPMLAGVAVGSVVLGAVLSRVSLYATVRIEDVPTAVIVQFLGTFAVWMIAERLGLSGILTVVVFAILVARTAPDLISARLRIQSYAVWDVVVFVLNVLAFMLIGLQLKPILQRLSGSTLAHYLEGAAAICATVIVVRIVWVMLYGVGARPLAR